MVYERQCKREASLFSSKASHFTVIFTELGQRLPCDIAWMSLTNSLVVSRTH